MTPTPPPDDVAPPDDQADRDDAIWSRGYRAAMVGQLADVLHRLGYDDVEAQRARWIIEREQTVARLREVCRRFGDNDWSNDLHLGDVIDKHLAKYIEE